MIVYIDELIILNFIIDTLILLTLGITLKQRINKYRLLLASIIGSLSIIILFISFNNIELLLYKIILSSLMVICAFNFISVKYFLRNIIYFFFISIIYGGFLYFVIDNTSFKQSGLVFIKSNTDINIMFLLLLSPIILYTYIKMIHRRYNLDLKVNIKVLLDNKNIDLYGYVDTGNTLTEPYSGKDVIITNNKEIIKYILESYFILIPYDSIKGKGFIKGSKFNILINNKRFNDVIIAYTDEKINIDGIDTLLNKNMIGEYYD